VLDVPVQKRRDQAAFDRLLRRVPEAVNLGETDRLGNYWAGETSKGLLIQAGPGSAGGIGAWRTKRSGWAA
jgi:hypothetical protein